MSPVNFFNKRAGTRILHVTCRDGGQPIRGAIAADIPLIIVGLGAVQATHRSGAAAPLLALSLSTVRLPIVFLNGLLGYKLRPSKPYVRAVK